MEELAIVLVVMAAIWNAVVLYARLAAWAIRRTKQVSKLIEEASASAGTERQVRP